MPRGKDQRASEGEQASPTRFPETTPQMLPSGDYSYTLEIVMKTQLSIGKLIEAVDGLKSTQKEQAAKLDRISHQIYAAIAVVVIVGTVIGFFAKSINDLITHYVLASVSQQQQTVSVPTPVPNITPTYNSHATTSTATAG